MARSVIALKDFLARHCRIHPMPASVDEQEYYILRVSEGRPFMTESHLREILREVNPPNDGLAAFKHGPANNIVLILGQNEANQGTEKIKIPVSLVDSLSEKQAFLVLRNLQGIQSDIEEGRLHRDRLEVLFGDAADIRISATPEGERVFEITGKLSAGDQRRYMERYAEQVASRTLFDVAKALNNRLAQYVPEEMREQFFIEGRDLSDRKIRYGEEVSTELTLSDEGACVYTTLIMKNPQLKEPIAKLMQQAILDPFGLSITHYMGKHNAFSAGKRPLVKVPPLSSFFGWLKWLFGGGK